MDYIEHNSGYHNAVSKKFCYFCLDVLALSKKKNDKQSFETKNFKDLIIRIFKLEGCLDEDATFCRKCYAFTNYFYSDTQLCTSITKNFLFS